MLAGISRSYHLTGFVAGIVLAVLALTLRSQVKRGVVD